MTMTDTERERWWRGIIYTTERDAETDNKAEPELAAHKDEAISQIEAALAQYRDDCDFTAAMKEKRAGISPWAFDRKKVVAMTKRVEELKQDLQTYLPGGRWMPSKPDVRQTVAELDVVAEYLKWLEERIKIHAKRGGREREIELQWLVWRLGKIREHFTGRGLGWDGATERYIHACCAVERGWGRLVDEKEETITNAKTYVIKNPEMFRYGESGASG